MTYRNRRRALLTVPLALLAFGAFAVTSGFAEDLFVDQLAPLHLRRRPAIGRASAQEPPRAAPETKAVEPPPPTVLAAPPPAPDGFGGPRSTPDLEGASLKALAYQYMAPIYERPSLRSLIVGRARRGTLLPSPTPVGGSCGSGSWYRIQGGFVCSGDGFHVGDDGLPEIDQELPDVGSNVPYSYAEVVFPRAPRFYRIPTLDELSQIEHAEVLGDPLPSLEVVERYMDGAYFVAVDRRVETPIGPFVRTVRGRYVREADVRPAEPSGLHGEVLRGGELPLALVPGAGDVPLFRLEDDVPREVGHAERYARAPVVAERRVGGVDYVGIEDGLWLRRGDVRVAEATVRPDGVDADDRWIHVDLDSQVLVAYEGDTPRYATLVASGKPGWDTPTGLHRIVSKLSTITMKGDDPREGYYEVEDVPWTMYYEDSFALHGAYWHDAFGDTRSHGCTNLAPADARWLFGFTSPKVPEGWQGRLLAHGTWVYLTRDSES